MSAYIRTQKISDCYEPSVFEELEQTENQEGNLKNN